MADLTLKRRRSAGAQLDRFAGELRRASRTTVAKQVIGRGGDGVELHRPLDGTCPARAGLGNHEVGAITLQAVDTAHYRGIVGTGLSGELVGGVVRIDRQEPRNLAPGATQEVRIIGRGFRPSTTWQYLLPPTEETVDMPNPDLTIESVHPESGTEHRLVVTCGPEAPLTEGAPLAFDPGGRAPGPSDEPTRLRAREEDVYGIAPPTARYLAYWAHGDPVLDDLWVGAWLGADGAVQSFLGFLERDSPFPDVATQLKRCAPILSDPSGRVGAGALLQPHNDRLAVIDFAGGVRHVSQSFGDDDLIGAAFHEGEVLALVHERGERQTCAARLVRLPCDLASASNAASLDLGPVHPDLTTDWLPARACAFGTEAAYLSVEWAVYDLEQSGYQVARLPYDGSAATQAPEASGDAAGPEISVALPWAPGGAVRGVWHWQGGLGTDPVNDPAWRRWISLPWGEEGGPSAGPTVVTWDGQGLREVDPEGAGEGPLIDVPDAEHPELGPLGPPDLIFPAF